MMMHTTGHRNVDRYVTTYSGPEVFVNVTLKFVDDDDDDDDDDDGDDQLEP